MVAYFKISVKIKKYTDIKPPLFTGSMFRGAFGSALKKVVCINPKYRCEGCFAKDNCIYFDFYEQKNIPHQYRFDIKINPENFNFSLYLFEEACEKLPYILSALHQMLTQNGLGADRDKFEIENIECNGITVYENGEFKLSEIEPEEFTVSSFEQRFKLRFATPLRMKYRGRLLASKPPLELLLVSILNRLNEIKDLPKIKLPFEPSYREKRSNIYFKDMTRYSNRQKTKMQIGGIMGEIEYSQCDEKSYQLLKLGEIIGVGKQTVFGLGKIEIEEIKDI